jgi:hypothetical protein
VLELAVGEVQGDRAGALRNQPARALRRAGADLQDVLALQFLRRAEQLGLDLVQALGAPYEAVVAEEGAVLDLVLVGVSVPPAPVGPGALRDPGGTPSGLRLGFGSGRGFVGYGLLDDRLPRRTLPSKPVVEVVTNGAPSGARGLVRQVLCRVCGDPPRVCDFAH